MRLLSLPLFPITILSVFALQSLAQTAPSPEQDQVPVFKANARAVLVDVVVTDSHGNPVSGVASTGFQVDREWEAGIRRVL